MDLHGTMPDFFVDPILHVRNLSFRRYYHVVNVKTAWPFGRIFDCSTGIGLDSSVKTKVRFGPIPGIGVGSSVQWHVVGVYLVGVVISDQLIGVVVDDRWEPSAQRVSFFVIISFFFGLLELPNLRQVGPLREPSPW